MPNPQKDVRGEIEKTIERLRILEEINILDEEYRFIESKYLQHRQTLSDKLTALDAKAS